MDQQEELMQLLNEAIDSVKTTMLTLEAASPLLGQRHTYFGNEASRLITALHTIEGDVIALFDAGEVDPEFEALMSTPKITNTVCALCSHPVQPGERHVPVVGGGLVHIACADRLAAQTLARQRRWAWIHALALAVVVFVAGHIGGFTPWLLVFAVLGLALHVALHRRWWYYLRRDLGRWLLLGSQR